MDSAGKPPTRPVKRPAKTVEAPVKRPKKDADYHVSAIISALVATDKDHRNTELDLARLQQEYSDESLKSVIEAFAQNKTFQKLTVCFTQLSSKNFDSLIAALKTHPRVSEIITAHKEPWGGKARRAAALKTLLEENHRIIKCQVVGFTQDIGDVLKRNNRIAVIITHQQWSLFKLTDLPIEQRYKRDVFVALKKSSLKNVFLNLSFVEADVLAIIDAFKSLTLQWLECGFAQAAAGAAAAADEPVLSSRVIEALVGLLKSQEQLVRQAKLGLSCR